MIKNFISKLGPIQIQEGDFKIKLSPEISIETNFMSNIAYNSQSSDFLNLIKNDLDYVIGNKEEIMALFETDNFENALSKAIEGDMSEINFMINLFENPYIQKNISRKYLMPSNSEEQYVTFCGT